MFLLVYYKPGVPIRVWDWPDPDPTTENKSGSESQGKIWIRILPDKITLQCLIFHFDCLTYPYIVLNPQITYIIWLLRIRTHVWSELDLFEVSTGASNLILILIWELCLFPRAQGVLSYHPIYTHRVYVCILHGHNVPVSVMIPRPLISCQHNKG